MTKACEICGKFMPEKFHGACPKCLESSKRLPPNLKILWDRYQAGKFNKKEKSSVRGVLRAVNTLLFDGEWYSYKWDPASNLRIVIGSIEDREYLTLGIINEIETILNHIAEEERRRA